MLGGWGGRDEGVFGARHRDLQGPGGVSLPLQPPPSAGEPRAGGRHWGAAGSWGQADLQQPRNRGC